MESNGPAGSEASPTHEVTLSTCPFCASGCGLLLHTRGSELVGVSPSERHPVSAGRLCARGWSAHEAPVWGKRLLFPTIRNRSGSRRGSWEEGLAAAAEQLRALLLAGKRVGVLCSGRVTNEEAFLSVRLAREALGSPHVDASLRSSYEALLSGLRPGGGSLDLDGILGFVEGSDLIVLMEDDLAISHPQVAFLVMRALKRGARLVTLGPARTQMSSLARPHIFLDPAGPPDDPPGFEGALGDVSEVASVALILAPFTSDISRLRATTRALAGKLEAWGGGWGPEIRSLPLPVLANARGAFEMGLSPGILPGARDLGDQGARDRLLGAWGQGVTMEAGWGAERMLREVDGLVVLRENPPETQPSPSESLRALAAKECLVVLDAYSSPTAELASVALPLGAFSETSGTLVSLDGSIQRWRPFRPPPGEAREGWKVLVDLLTALGVPASYESLTDVAAEIGRVVPEFAQGALEERGEPWSRRLPEIRIPGREAPSRPGPEGSHAVPDSPDSFRIALVGAHDWGDDLAVGLSPTLRRDGVSMRKRFPEGRISMSRSDAERLGIREGWKVRVRSQQGELEIPVSVSRQGEPGILLAPFGFRDRFHEILGGNVAGRVTLEHR